jgi:CBS-domain-containing membrane protein
MSEETTAKEIMTRDIVRANEGMTIEEALKALINHRITGLPVVNESGKMTGVISEYDILNQISKSKKKNAKIFQEPILFSKKIDAISEDTPLDRIVSEFIDTKFRRLPVIDKAGNLVGIITRRDLMRVYYYRARLAD